MNLGLLLALIIIAVTLAVGLKSRIPEMNTLISVAICILLIAICIGRMKSILEMLDKVNAYINIDKAYLVILLKLIGVAYICEFASGITKEAGYNAISTQIEMLGKLTMLVISLPVLMQVLETVFEML